VFIYVLIIDLIESRSMLVNIETIYSNKQKAIW